MRAPLFYFVVIASAWLATLGACGRTAPLVEDTYGYAAAAADEGDETGGSRTGGTSGSSNGGSRTGGSSNGGTRTGGTSNGGNAASPSTGGTAGTDVDDGGATFSGGTAGNIAAGGTEPAGGAFSTGGASPSVGGGPDTGGVGASGGAPAGGSSPMTGGTGNETGGTSNETGGTGGTAGMGGMTTLPTGFIRCGDTACDSELSICCQRRSSPSTCETPDTNCMGATLTCSGANSCDPGEVCCYHARQSSCQQSCEVSVGSPGNSPTIILCDSSEECGPEQTCVFAPRGVAYCGENL